MKHYIKIAKQYFQYLEGLQLYPSHKSFWFWAWIFASAIWLGTLAHFAIVDHSQRGTGTFFFIIITEVIWLAVTFRISSWKERRFLEVTNLRMGTSFNSASEGRLHVLTSLINVPPSEFLKVAKEIDELLSLERKFRKHSDLNLSELGRSVYDRDSKARLLTLVIALISMTVALVVKSNATLETVFEVFADPSWRQFMVIVALAAMVLFFAVIGLRIFVLTIIDGLASWSIKLMGSSLFTDWLLAYLIRDLIHYHSREVQPPHSVGSLDSIENPNPRDNAILVESTIGHR